MTITGDFSEVNKLAVDLGKAASKLLPEVDAVMKRGAQNVKDEMTADAKGSEHFRGKRRASVAESISYDRAYGLGSIGYEVGPDKERGGNLAAIAYFGGVNGGGGTLDIDRPLRNEEPRLLKALSELGDGLL